MLRSLSIALRLTPLALSFARDRHRWLVAGAPVRRTVAFHEARAARLVRTIAALGPAFVKLAQIVGARADLVPEPYLGALGALHDQVPPIPGGQVRDAIEDAYGQPVETLFEAFDWAPLAAASLGQVHRARWDGQDVVVKVLRPGVERRVAEDLRIAERMLGLVERRIPASHLRGLRNVVREFGNRVGEEMDFRHEAANAVAMRANFAGRDRVRVPRVVPSLVRERVLVLEYMPGTRIDRLQDAVAAGRLDATDLVRRVIELYMHMMLVDGFFHADPHPGNLLVQDDGTIVVLDFGMVVRVDRTLRRTLARTAFAGIRRDVDALIDGFYALGVLEPAADRAVARALVDSLLEIAHTMDTTSLDRVQLVADQVMARLYDFPVTLPSDLVYFARTTALIEGLGTRYDARFNPVTFAAPVALRMHRDILASLREPGETLPLADVVDWPTAIGAVAGEVAAIVTRAGREIAGVLGRLGLELGLGAPPREPPGPAAVTPAAPPRALPSPPNGRPPLAALGAGPGPDALPALGAADAER